MGTMPEVTRGWEEVGFSKQSSSSSTSHLAKYYTELETRGLRPGKSFSVEILIGIYNFKLGIIFTRKSHKAVYYTKTRESRTRN